MATPTNISGGWKVTSRIIRTDYWMKPDPNRNFDWEAWIDDTADLGMRMGFGATRDEAIEDLLEQLEAEVD